MEIEYLGLTLSDEEQITYEAIYYNIMNLLQSKKREAMLTVCENLIVSFPFNKIHKMPKLGHHINSKHFKEYSFKKNRFSIDLKLEQISKGVDLSHVRPFVLNQWKQRDWLEYDYATQISYNDFINSVDYTLKIGNTISFESFQLRDYITDVYAKISATKSTQKSRRIFQADIVGFKVKTIPISLEFPYKKNFISSLKEDSLLVNPLKDNAQCMYLSELVSCKTNRPYKKLKVFVFADWNDHCSDIGKLGFKPFKCILIEQKYDDDYTYFELIPFQEKYSYYKFTCLSRNKEKARYAIIAYFSSRIKNRRQNFELDESFRACGILSFSKGFPLDLSILKHDLGDRQHQFNCMRIEGNQCMMMT